MDQEFIKLVQLLLGNQGNLITHYGAEINNHVTSLNKDLNLKDDFEFKGNHKCSNGSVNQVVAPVVFASSGEQPVFAYFGLNPYFDSTAICIEKGLAGDNLKDYAAFYNSKSCSANGVFPYVFNIPKAKGGYKISTYYQNLMMILNSLMCGKLITWGHFSNHFRSQEEKVKHYIDQIQSCPIIVPEFIPFHSKQTSINSLKFQGMSLRNLYQQYHETMFDLLDRRMDPNGVLFIHGNSPAKIARLVLEHKISDIIDYSNAGDHTHTIATWEDRTVVILNSKLRVQNGPFNSNENISALIDDIINYMSAHGRQFPCKCSDTLSAIASTMRKVKLSNNKATQTMKSKINVPQNPVVNNPGMHLPGQVARTIPTFSKDPRGLNLKVGDHVSTNLNGKIKHGVIVRFLEHILPAGRGKKIGDELAKIQEDGTNRMFYRFYDEII